MSDNYKISQRRLLLFDQRLCPRFRTMPSTDSESWPPLIPITPKKWTPYVGFVGRHPSEWVDGLHRTEWTACAGIAGRHGPDYAEAQKLVVNRTLCDQRSDL